MKLTLTESEKSRISKMYNAGLLTEAPNPPSTEDEIKAFQDWMDNKFGEWAYSNRRRRNYKVNQNPSRGYGSFGSNTSRAWEQYGQTYLDEKSGSSSTTASTPTVKYVYVDSTGATKGPFTLDELKKENIGGSVLVSKKTDNGSWEGWKKAETYGEFDWVTPSAPTAPAAPPKSTSSTATDKLPDLYNAAKGPQDPMSGGGNTFSLSLSGFNGWFESIYSTAPSVTPVIDEKKRYAMLQDKDSKKQLIYTYNDNLKTWNLPREVTPEMGTAKLNIIPPKKTPSPGTTTTTTTTVTAPTGP